MYPPNPNLTQFEVVSFDCYGTLIDWEAGILAALEPLFVRRGDQWNAAEILRRYADVEASIQATGYRPYREVLREVVRALGRASGFEPAEPEVTCLEESLPTWLPFPDTATSLRRLKSPY